MVRPEVIRRRLLQLGEYLVILQHYRQYDVESFCTDPERYGSAERFLQLAIESTLDIGAHIVADGDFGRVEQSRDVPMRFRERGYMDVDLEQRWIRMIGFRNVLVHEYLEIDRRIVYQAILNDLTDLAALQKVFARFLV